MRVTKAVASSRSIACEGSYNSNYMNPVYVHNSTTSPTTEEAAGRLMWSSSKGKPHGDDQLKQQALFMKEGAAAAGRGDGPNINILSCNNSQPQYICKAPHAIRPSPPPQLSNYINFDIPPPPPPPDQNASMIYFNKLQQKEAELFNECNAHLELMKQSVKAGGGNYRHEYADNEEDDVILEVRGGGGGAGTGNQYQRLVEEHAAGAAFEEDDASPTMMLSNAQNSSIQSISGGAQTPRKPRRCWSPELHQRFLHALHQLGGPQLATPKQIQEVMHVEGLTNDEVKSHLQKFRLHTRRPAPLHASEPAQRPHHLVLFGGIWVPTSPAESAPAAPLASCQLANSGQTMSPGNHNSFMQFQHLIGQNPMQTLMRATSSEQMDVHVGMETASEVDVARSDQSTSQNGEGGGVDKSVQYEGLEDTEIHLGSKPMITKEITSPIAKARYQ